MGAQIIDGRKIAGDILQKVKSQVAQLDFQPLFCDVLVGDDPVAAQYVRMKENWAHRVGIGVRAAHFPAEISTQDLVTAIKKLAQLPGMSGLIIQLPLPAPIDAQEALNAIDSRIDVDCIGAVNTEKFYQGRPYLVFPTAAAVLELLKSISLDLSHKHILVIGQGQLVGQPVTYLLKQQGLAVQTVDKYTPSAETATLLKSADVIISAAGQAGLVTGTKIKAGAVVIDAGTSEFGGGVVGDVDADSVMPVAAALSPVPGGVGPVTVAKLLENVAQVAAASMAG